MIRFISIFALKLVICQTLATIGINILIIFLPAIFKPQIQINLNGSHSNIHFSDLILPQLIRKDKIMVTGLNVNTENQYQPVSYFLFDLMLLKENFPLVLPMPPNNQNILLRLLFQKAFLNAGL